MKLHHPQQTKVVILICVALFLALALFGPAEPPTAMPATSNANNNPWKPRRIVGEPNQENGDETANNGHPHATERTASCSRVSYGNLNPKDYPESIVDPKDLPLNELLLHLDHPTYVSPPNPDGPTIVEIGLFVFGISDLDPGSNTFFLEGYLDLIWCDSRTKFDSSVKTEHIYLEEDAKKEIEKIWWPAITFVNEVTKRNIENQELLIYDDGTIEYREKFGVQLATNYNMEEFPFDKQVLLAEIESFAWNSSFLQFHIEKDLIGFDDEFSVPEHELTGIDERLESRQEQRDRYPFSELVTEIYVKRIPTYYMTKVIIPLTLIVCISWAVFWMDGDALADRMAISFTGVLTSVAYQFVVSDSLPRHIYNTFLDNFVLLSFVIMILTVVVNIAVHAMHSYDHIKEAKLVDRICRVLFPVMFIASIFLLAGAQLITDNIPSGGVLGATVGLLVAVSILVGFIMYSRILAQERRNMNEVLDEDGGDESIEILDLDKDKNCKDSEAFSAESEDKRLLVGNTNVEV